MKTKILLILFFSLILGACSKYHEKDPLLAPPFLKEDIEKYEKQKDV